MSFKNTLFFNRAKQFYTTSYSYRSNKSKNTLSFGYIESEFNNHELNFNHKLKNSLLININSSIENKKSNSENFDSKNFNFH